MNDAGWIQLRSIRHTSFVRNKTTYSRKESRVAKELEMTKKFVTVALRDFDDCESPEERKQQTRKFLITF